jgi:hypothetical protein
MLGVRSAPSVAENKRFLSPSVCVGEKRTSSRYIASQKISCAQFNVGTLRENSPDVVGKTVEIVGIFHGTH